MKWIKSIKYFSTAVQDETACPRWTGAYRVMDTTNQQKGHKGHELRTSSMILGATLSSGQCCFSTQWNWKSHRESTSLRMELTYKQPREMIWRSQAKSIQLDHDANLRLTLYTKDGVQYFISNKNKTKQLNISFENRNVDVLQHGQALPI